MPDKLLANSESLRHDFFENQGGLLSKLAQNGQSPEALFIGCSDSRVTPERMLGAQPGDLFMLRNIANIIPPYYQTEIGIISTLEYAILRLKVPHIVVCGHTDCGGIRGLDEDIDISHEPALARWLDLARPAQREVDFSLPDHTPEERHLAIVERNVVHQLNNIQSYPFIREELENNRLELHGWVYHLEQQQISYFDPETNKFVFL